MTTLLVGAPLPHALAAGADRRGAGRRPRRRHRGRRGGGPAGAGGDRGRRAGRGRLPARDDRELRLHERGAQALLRLDLPPGGRRARPERRGRRVRGRDGAGRTGSTCTVATTSPGRSARSPRSSARSAGSSRTTCSRCWVRWASHSWRRRTSSEVRSLHCSPTEDIPPVHRRPLPRAAALAAACALLVSGVRARATTRPRRRPEAGRLGGAARARRLPRPRARGRGPAGERDEDPRLRRRAHRRDVRRRRAAGPLRRRGLRRPGPREVRLPDLLGLASRSSSAPTSRW